MKLLQKIEELTLYTIEQNKKIEQQNTQLQNDVANLQAQVIQLQQQVGETQVLAALVDFSRARPENTYKAAAVIGRDPSPFLHYVIINRGSNDGILRGMPVVTDQPLQNYPSQRLQHAS